MVDQLGPQFERSTGHKLTIKWVPGPAVQREVDNGEPFDVAVTQSDMIATLYEKNLGKPAGVAAPVALPAAALRAGPV